MNRHGAGRIAYPGPAPMKVLFLSPHYPEEMLDFTRGLAEVGAEVYGVGEPPASALPARVRPYLHDYVQVPGLFDEQRSLAPLVDTAFSRCKSDVKFLESSAFGVPTIASDSVVYRHHDGHGLTACRTPRDWTEALESIWDPRRRAEASEAIADGDTILILSDWRSTDELAPIPSLLFTAAVHHHLIREKTRTQVGLIVESGEAREVHHFCMLIGFGAAAVNPYLAFAAMLMAGMDGIKNKIDPGEPTEKNIYDLPPEEAAEIRQVPGSLEAVNHLISALIHVLPRMTHPDGGTYWDHTLVVFGSEFSRTARGDRFNSARGSDHNGDNSTRWMSMPFFGGPVPGGRTVGATTAREDLRAQGTVYSYRGLLNTLMDGLGCDPEVFFPADVVVPDLFG